jgi:hypothetical protein
LAAVDLLLTAYPVLLLWEEKESFPETKFVLERKKRKLVSNKGFLAPMAMVQSPNILTSLQSFPVPDQLKTRCAVIGLQWGWLGIVVRINYHCSIRVHFDMSTNRSRDLWICFDYTCF